MHGNHHADGAKHVHRLKFADQRQFQPIRTPFYFRFQRLSLRMRYPRQYFQIAAVTAVRHHFNSPAAANFRQFRKFGNVGVQNRGSVSFHYPGKKLFLGLQIIFHGQVIVKVILGEVGKAGRFDFQTVQPVLFNADA